ncbi:MAG: energy transducer TonB [Sphingomonas sp.]
MAPFNPPAAIDAHVVGDAVLACRVRLNRHVHDCRVLTEQPRGYDLGSAAIEASHIFRIWPAKQDGKAIDDAWVVVPAHYDFADPKH